MSGLASIDANAYGAGLLAVALGGYLVASSFTTLVNRQEEYLQKWGTTGSQSLQVRSVSEYQKFFHHIFWTRA
jgi:hypothetical protein